MLALDSLFWQGQLGPTTYHVQDVLKTSSSVRATSTLKFGPMTFWQWIYYLLTGKRR